MDMLSKELQANASLQPLDSRDPIEAAVNVEYSIFSEVKSSQSYKLDVNKNVSIRMAYLTQSFYNLYFILIQVKEIQSSTRNNNLHPILKKHVQAEGNAVNLVAKPDDQSTGFVKASKLFTSDKPLSKPSNSELVGTSSTSPKYSMFTSASKLLSNTRVKNNIVEGTIKMKLYEDICSKSVSQFMDDFDYGDEYQLPDNSDEKDTSPMACPNTSDDEASVSTDTTVQRGQSCEAIEQLDDSLEEKLIESESKGNEDSLMERHTGNRSPPPTLFAK